MTNGQRPCRQSGRYLQSPFLPHAVDDEVPSMRRSLAQYHDCLEGQQVQYNPHMPTNSGIYFSATIASSRERASSRIPSTRPSRRVTPDLPRRGTTQVNLRAGAPPGSCRYAGRYRASAQNRTRRRRRNARSDRQSPPGTSARPQLARHCSQAMQRPRFFRCAHELSPVLTAGGGFLLRGTKNAE
jgi:hypothetical protein